MAHYFGTDGIRDIANQGNLTPDMVLRIGHAFGRVMRERGEADGRPRALIVRDTRISGSMISGILSGALLAHGVDVDDAGVLPTPACALLVRRMGYDFGIVISASHNPVADNGIKFFGPTGRKLPDDLQVEIERGIDQAAPATEITGAALGRHREFLEAGDLYIDAMARELFKDLDLSGLKIVIDAANGAASKVAPRILVALGAEIEPIACSPDKLNINDGTGPYKTDQCVAAVLEHGADLGIVLDGDGDRTILVDHTGKVRDGDYLMGVLGREAVQAPDIRAEIVVTVMSNMGLHVLAKSDGVRLHETPVGDRYVAARMEETGAPFGGEQSGHIIFQNEDGWFGDGLYSALRIIRIMRHAGASLYELTSRLEQFPQVLLNVKVREKPPMSELPPIQEALGRHQAALGDEGRILLRYSGTEMLARVMIEGRDEARIESAANEIADRIREAIGA